MICQLLISTAIDESFRNSTNSPQASPSQVRDVNSLITTPAARPGAGVGVGVGIGEGDGVGVGEGVGEGVGTGDGVGVGVGVGNGDGSGDLASVAPGSGEDGTLVPPHPWTTNNANNPTTTNTATRSRVITSVILSP